MKEAFSECAVSLVLTMVVVFMSGGWLVSHTGIHPWALLVLSAVTWSLIGWLRMGFVQRKLQFMRQFLHKEAAEVLADKAQKLDNLYKEQVWDYERLREDPASKYVPKRLRWTKRAIRKAKPDFWRAVGFALENKLIKHKPASYRDMLPKNGLED